MIKVLIAVPNLHSIEQKSGYKDRSFASFVTGFFIENNKAYSVGLYLGDSTGYVVAIRFKYKFRQAIAPGHFHFEGRKICVTGVIKKRGLIKVDDPAQLKPDRAD
ncbi:MAG: hypothetical protein V4577_14290 [Bacteroidota bacterium]